LIDFSAIGTLQVCDRVTSVGAINAGIVSAGINAFYTQLCFGLVIVLSVVLQTIIERRIRRQSLTGR